MPKLRHASGRIVGFTKIKYASESSFAEHYPIVEYETHENEVIWAEAQPSKEGMVGLNTVVDIMCRPGRARSVRIVQSPNQTQGFITLEKNLEIVLSLIGIGILFAVAIWYHGFALHILGPIFIMLVFGYALGHLTKKGFSKREERMDANHYQSICNRLIAAQDKGSVPANLAE
ncbi:hypothetical protein GCM10008927_21030 [Amylibacter ulvae]|uniref:Uncharacterized protein n=1 Tax=Paramylibacter ulvae TaxID=1651968 RepID=A0ABQ3D8H0_9RHOB|nr:hypothetical protein [Amylibacter ulvae]GHA54986.1 hypothetical protein GCM10008927_21030 [Amylibacter ulvae]